MLRTIEGIKLDPEVFFTGTDEEIDAAEKRLNGVKETFRHIITQPDFQAMEFRKNVHLYIVSRATYGDNASWRISSFLDGSFNGKTWDTEPIMHSDYDENFHHNGGCAGLLEELAGHCFNHDLEVEII